MKKIIALLPCLMLSGCFMLNNLSCAFQGTCPSDEELEKQRKLRVEKENTILKNRCLMEGRLGSNAYVQCRVDMDIYLKEYDISTYSPTDEDLNFLVNRFSKQAEQCYTYTGSETSQNFKECLKMKTASEREYYRNENLNSSIKKAGILANPKY